jgi:hypothetical protein
MVFYATLLSVAQTAAPKKLNKKKAKVFACAQTESRKTLLPSDTPSAVLRLLDALHEAKL